MNLTKAEIMSALEEWGRAWDNHDLVGVLSLFHDDVLFDNWTGGKAEGKVALNAAWTPWFENHGGFLFTIQDIFVDEGGQKVLYQWQVDWPSSEKGYEGLPEKRYGVDVMHFKDGKIINKLTFSKTTVEIDGARVKLQAQKA